MISIITPTYNPGRKIIDTYESIIVQEQAVYEYFVVDGGSNDGSIDIFKKWQETGTAFNFISESDNGLYDAMNKGVKFASGEYVLFLGAGDCIHDKSVLYRIETELALSHPDVLYGYVVFCYPDGRREDYKKKIDWLYPVRSTPISHQAVIAKRQLLIDYPFDVSYKIAADQDWIMNIYKKKNNFRYIDIPIANYDMTGVSASENGRSLGFTERCDIHKKYYPVFYEAYNTLRNIKDLIRK